MSLYARHDGWYDKSGIWQQGKKCLVDCKERCTCRPPNGQWYSKEHDTGWREGKLTSPAYIEFETPTEESMDWARKELINLKDPLEFP